MWFVYILLCGDNTFYTGITTDLDRRLFEHNNSNKSAKYTRIRRPVKIVYSCKYKSRSDASKEEYRIKQLTKLQKEKLTQKNV